VVLSFSSCVSFSWIEFTCVEGYGLGVSCSGSEAGSYLRLIDFVYHSTLGLRVIKKKKIT